MRLSPAVASLHESMLQHAYKMVSVKHPQVEALPGIFVDELMAALLLNLWSEGIETRWSCQGSEKSQGYLVFATEEDYKRFLSLRGTGEYFLQPRCLDMDMYEHMRENSGLPPEEVEEIFFQRVTISFEHQQLPYLLRS